MQIIGVYLEKCDNGLIKNLHKDQWYPFGNFENCHKIISDTIVKDIKKFSQLKSVLKENQDFNKRLYSLTDIASCNQNIPININCIVGKNGSGKTSLLTIIYRIINNLSCEIKSHLTKYNADYHPIWATGFNAELYYEMHSSIYCIKVSNNETYRTVDDKEDYAKQVALDQPELTRLVKLLQIKDNHYDVKDVISFEKENFKKLNIKNEEFDDYFLKVIGDNLFYTVGTNYSLYSNSVVTDKWDENEEKWLGNIYHKNDGYFTPVVLVPYKSEWTTIDTKKELCLAKERISTLSLLTYAQTGGNFIENLVPVSINYELIEKNKTKKINYLNEINRKSLRIINEYYVNLEKNNPLDIYEGKQLIGQNIPLLKELRNIIRGIWEKKYFDKDEIKKYKESLKKQDQNQRLLKNITKRTLAYLTYKTIKICLYYDVYKNEFPEEFDKDIFKTFIEKPKDCKNIIEAIIANLFTEKFPLNFSNLKIKQCITFLDNLKFYLGDSLDEVTVDAFNEKFCNDENMKHKNEALTYDYIFENLPPAYFNKQIYFRKKNEDSNNDNKEKITISSMSSGESQLLNSMSYAVYHIKNAIASNIKYNSINLIFDEAELYYHPEYQRVFIKDLLGIIGRSNLEGVEGINITIVTHSPFILSDIPNENLLCLKDGKTDNNVLSKTLGANFYDLLKNQFFMESSIGSVTEKFVNKIIDDFNIINDENISNERKNIIREEYKNKYNKQIQFYEDFVNKLSDQYLRMTLKNMIGIIKEESFVNRRINELNEKISELKGNNNA